jgi:hypothetical protein
MRRQDCVEEDREGVDYRNKSLRIIWIILGLMNYLKEQILTLFLIQIYENKRITILLNKKL